jgi:hypothetical protein
MSPLASLAVAFAMTGPAQIEGSPADAPTAVVVETVTPREVGLWRTEIHLGPHEVFGAGLSSFSPLQVGVSTSLERNFGDLLPAIPGANARVGLSFANRRSGREGRLDLTEVELGIGYQFPHTGLWGVVFPYARVDALGAWLSLGLQGGQVDVFVPGVAAALGLRAALPWIGDSVRFYGLAEGLATYRATVAPRLRGPSDPDDPIRDPGVPLGAVNLSGYGVRFGVGLEF